MKKQTVRPFSSAFPFIVTYLSFFRSSPFSRCTGASDVHICFVHNYLLSLEMFNADTEPKNKTQNTRSRVRRHASLPSNNTPSTIKEQLFKNIDRLVTEASVKMCAKKGAVCVPGPRGSPGQTGAMGQKGSRGRRGQKGRTGTRGAQGIMGPPGRSGKQGIMGPPGQSGEKGEKGDAGPRGMPGLKGDPGESLSSPNVVVNPPSLTVNETEAASLQCSAGGNPEPVMVWSKVSGSLPEGRSAVFGGKLEVQTSQMNDSGVYQCTARNILGVARKQVKLVINGQ